MVVLATIQYLHWALIPNTPIKALRVYLRRLGRIFAFSHTTSEGIIADNSGSEMAYNFAIGISHYPICKLYDMHKAGKRPLMTSNDFR